MGQYLGGEDMDKSLGARFLWTHGSYGHGKSWNFSKSWKVMENGESHGKVMEF